MRVPSSLTAVSGRSSLPRLRSSHRAPPSVEGRNLSYSTFPPPPPGTYSRLRLEVEGALYGVAPRELPDHPVLGDVHLVDRGLGHIGWRAGNRAEDRVVQRRGPPLRIGVGGHLRVEHLSNTDRPLAPLDAVFDWHALYCDRLPHQLGQIRWGAAQLAGEDLQERLLLLGSGCVIEVEHDAPVARQDIAGDLGDADQREAGDVQAADLAAVNVIGDKGVAF